MPEIPAFPLGTVLLPGQLLPLQVFEPRYRVLLFDIREEDPAEFLVVMIERGSEVGGGDQRSDAGCVARVIDTEDLPDGRSMVAVLGTRVVTITGWLPEDPYPRAEIAERPDGPWSSAEATPELASLTTTAREVADLAVSLGSPAWPQDLMFSEDPVEHLWQLAILSPLATLDRQRLLCERSPSLRAEMLDGFLSEQLDMLRARLEWGDGSQDQRP